MPGHAGLLGNEEADRLAKLGNSEEQDRVPIDLNSVKGAIRGLAKDMVHRCAKAAHPYLDPTPGAEELPRLETATYAQLRTRVSVLCKDTAHRFGRANDQNCLECGEADSVQHLLVECPAYAAARTRTSGGPVTTLRDVFQQPARLIINFLGAVGRAAPPRGVKKKKKK